MAHSGSRTLDVTDINTAIEACRKITGIKEFGLIGRAALLVQSGASDRLKRTTDMDIILIGGSEEDQDRINAQLGPNSAFERENNFYVHAVPEELLYPLPKEWTERSIQLVNAEVTVHCLAAEDVAICKLISGRPKDLHHLALMRTEGLCDWNLVRERTKEVSDKLRYLAIRQEESLEILDINMLEGAEQEITRAHYLNNIRKKNEVSGDPFSRFSEVSLAITRVEKVVGISHDETPNTKQSTQALDKLVRDFVDWKIDSTVLQLEVTKINLTNYSQAVERRLLSSNLAAEMALNDIPMLHNASKAAKETIQEQLQAIFETKQRFWNRKGKSLSISVLAEKICSHEWLKNNHNVDQSFCVGMEELRTTIANTAESQARANLIKVAQESIAKKFSFSDLKTNNSVDQMKATRELKEFVEGKSAKKPAIILSTLRDKVHEQQKLTINGALNRSSKIQ